MNSFRFGLWVGFVTGIALAALWDNQPEQDFDPSPETPTRLTEVNTPISEFDNSPLPA